MNQQTIWNSKSLLEYARSLKGSGASPEEVSKLKDWQTAVFKRLMELICLVPSLQEGYGLTDFTPGPGSLADDDPKIPELLAEYEKLTKKYQGVSDELIREKQAAGALVK